MTEVVSPAASLHEAISPWLQTASGRRFDILNPTPEMIDFDIDIPEQLARTARLGGAVRAGAYSVAQHCCVGADTLFAETHDARLAAYFLLHDAHESYCGGDVPTPVQRALDVIMPGARLALKQIQQRADIAIHARAALPYPLRAADAGIIHRHDLRMLATERQHLMGPSPAPWVASAENAEPLPLRGKLKIWPWPQAADEYRVRIARFLPHLVS